MMRLDDIKTDQVHLEVYECLCGFHVGLDAAYIDQVENISINCPACGLRIDGDVD